MYYAEYGSCHIVVKSVINNLKEKRRKNVYVKGLVLDRNYALTVKSALNRSYL